MYVYETLIIALGAYLIGSIPFGILLAKLFDLPDPRSIGSGNIGATNMLRTGRKDVALVTLLLDAGKGVVAVMLAASLHDAPAMLALAALMAAVGHMFSPWLGFKGGKGVATILGAVVTMSWIIGAAFCAVFALIFAITRYVSMASVVALSIIPIVTLFKLGLLPGALVATASSIAVFKHRANIERLKAGTEPKMGSKQNA